MAESVRFCGVALLAAVLLLLLREEKPSMAYPLRIAALLALLIAGVWMLAPLVAYARGLAKTAGAETYFAVAVKALCFSILVWTVSSICRDCGENTLATAVEFVGKAEILLLCLPLMQEILETVRALITGT